MSIASLGRARRRISGSSEVTQPDPTPTRLRRLGEYLRASRVSSCLTLDYEPLLPSMPPRCGSSRSAATSGGTEHDLLRDRREAAARRLRRAVPEDDHPGVDLILPGLDAIADRLDDVVALVLTHGHEDHIGAVPLFAGCAAPSTAAGSPSASSARSHPRTPPPRHRVPRGGRTRRSARPRVPRGHPLDPRCHGGGDPHRRWHGAAHQQLQDGPAPARTAGSPTCAASRGSAPKDHVDLFMVDSTNAEVSSFPPRSTRHRRPWSTSSRPPSRSSSWPASPRTSTGCSRS